MGRIDRRSRRASRRQAKTRSRSGDDASQINERTYAIPFEEVWQASMHLAGGGLRRWRILADDDHQGLINAETRRFMGRSTYPVDISITLDHNAQTLVRLSTGTQSEQPEPGPDLRRIQKFLRALDAMLYADR